MEPRWNPGGTPVEPRWNPGGIRKNPGEPERPPGDTLFASNPPTLRVSVLDPLEGEVYLPPSPALKSPPKVRSGLICVLFGFRISSNKNKHPLNMVAHSIAFGAFGLPWGSLLAPLGVPQATLGCRCGKGIGERSFWEGLLGALGSQAAPFVWTLAPFWYPLAGRAVFFCCFCSWSFWSRCLDQFLIKKWMFWRATAIKSMKLY